MGLQTRKKKNRIKNTSKILRLFCLVMVLGLIGINSTRVMAALENDKSSGIRSVRISDSQVAAATLAIGSHLIHINSLTSELYDAALESANQFNQHSMYYKSELADGTWFEITDASSIADITSSGVPVSREVIEALEFTHMTGADGITINLCTGQAVSVFDINSPYDLTIMEELEPLKVQHQILQAKTNKNDSDNTYLEIIGKFFGKSIRSDVTDEADLSLQALVNYKNGLSNREKPSMWSEKTEEIMASIDAERRVVSLTRLATFLDVLESNASGIETSYDDDVAEETEESGDEEEVEVPKNLIINSEVVSAVGECIQNVEESISNYEAKRMTNLGTTTSAKAEYQYRQGMIAAALAGNTSECDRLMEKLCNLQNIADGLVVNQSGELDILTAELVSASYTKYMADLRAGVSADYKAEKAKGASQAVLAQYLTQQKTAANTDRLEYQMFLDAQFQRMENLAAQNYAMQLINGISAMEQAVVQDAAEAYLKETVQEHLTWLRKMYSELVKNSADGTDMGRLEKEKSELAKQRQEALDRNDLAAANKLTAEMEAKQKNIDRLAESLNAILNSPNSSEAEKARARAGLGSNNTSELLASMADELSSSIRSGGDSDLETLVASLVAAAQLDPLAGTAALNQVQEALNNATGLDADIVSSIGDALKEAKDTLDGSAGGELSEEQLLELLDSVLAGLYGEEFENITSEQQAAAILALEWYGHERQSEVALECAAALAKRMAAEGNFYVYEKYDGKSDAYMSLQAISRVMGYRYVFDDAHNSVMLQKAKLYYVFTLKENTYETVGESLVALSTAPQIMNTLYIHGQDSSSVFDAKAEYIEKASFGVVGTPSVERIAKEIYDALLEGGA